MGYNVSWLAFRGCERNFLLRELGLVATGEASDYPRGMECGSALPDNGYLLFLNHPRHRFTEQVRSPFYLTAAKSSGVELRNSICRAQRSVGRTVSALGALSTQRYEMFAT